MGALVFVAQLLSACGGGGGGGGSSAGGTDTTAQPVPTEFRGTWRTTLAPNDVAQLTLTDVTYRIDRGADSATGTVGFAEGKIRFTNSSACAGLGEYPAGVSGTSLTFGVSTSEACPGRAQAVSGRTYSKVAP